ncbi:VOC family protein [Actinopolymorpha cephalotaxi]|uniref:Enzyme related to lactoylglutathione lyase n=1 Tax=Actinopolymorpha cephalotaxi TaxID=504797 RepID=A0ABX2SBQ3_9ACTN|nr:VOC family protein [Actinopolymorpha cephalotaxi]NYH85707.1 putative enzyme related to lactoylglutathione lyase [Actinopolymorpha cephalotaxi]
MTRSPQRYPHGDLVVVIDCSDLERSARFWTGLLGYERAGAAVEPYQSLVPPGGGCELLLQQVPDAKRTKNRVHLDLRTRDLDAEVERARSLGAALLTEEPVVEEGWGWHVLADPDGNEFCVLQPPEEYWRG